MNSFFAVCVYALYLPFLAVGMILGHYAVRRFIGRRFRIGYYPSAFALGMAVQFIQTFHRPSLAYVIEAKRDEDADEDEDGDPESLRKQLSRQLKRIRRGEVVERLVLRL